MLRLLDKNQARLTLERLGLSQQLTAQLRQLLHKPHGIFLVTGPTGSGKKHHAVRRIAGAEQPFAQYSHG